MDSQKKAKLKDIILQTIDNRGKTPPLSEQGYELIEVNAINPSSRTPIYTNVRKFIDEETYKNWFRDGTIKADDILVPTVGTIGNVSISKEDRGAIAQNLIALRVNKVVAAPDYIYYLMYSESFKRSLINLDIGGVQPSIKVPHMLDLQFTLPPLSEQKRIANILSSFDNKIEILKKENKILEDIAENIFKEWFVKYNFPNKDGKPYKDSGGKMIDSELGPIPEGWRVGKLGEMTELKSGYPFHSKHYTDKSKNRIIRIGDIRGDGSVNIDDTFYVVEESTKDTRTKEFLLEEGDLLISMSGTIGRIGVIPKHTNYLYLNQRVGKFFIKKPLFYNYIKRFILTKAFQDDVRNMGYGSVQMNINPTQIHQISIVVPDNHLIQIYKNIDNSFNRKAIAYTSYVSVLEHTKNRLIRELIK